MLERLAGTVLTSVLSKYFEPTDDRQKASVGVWSGYLCLDHLRVKTDVINAALAASGQPFQLVHASIRHVEITVPWSQWSTLLSPSSSESSTNSSSSTAVLVLDGIHVLVQSTPYEFQDDLLRQYEINKRRKALQEAADDIMMGKTSSDETTTTWWKEILQQQLQEGLLPAILERLQIHVRDVHVRVEDVQKSDPITPFGFGLVLESMHIQNEETESSYRRSTSSKSYIQKAAHLNHFGVYWNILEEDSDDVKKISTERRILRNSSAQDIVEALNQTIARRVATFQTTPQSSSPHVVAPLHSYLLQPIDVHIQITLSKTPKDVSQRPAITAVCTVTNVNFFLNDFQCLQLWQLVHHYQEHRYLSRRQYRRYRPTQSPIENPRAWWFYAVTVLRYQLGQTRFRYSAQRARQRLAERRVYCDLYERQLRAASPDTAAGPSGEPVRPLNEMEEQTLRDFEDGVEGDLSIPDILLFRILVQKRVGAVAAPVSRKQSSAFGSAVRTLVADDVQAEEEYERLLEYWTAWSNNESFSGDVDDEINLRACVSVKIQVAVDKGRLSFFSPLAATADEPYSRRLQERFLEFTYTGFSTCLSLMGDYETLSFDFCLFNLDAVEIRSNRTKSTFISRNESKVDRDASISFLEGTTALRQPQRLITIRVTKHSTAKSDFDYTLQARILGVQVVVEPEAEWLSRLHRLVQPLPQLKKLKGFWNELSLARINSWASRQLGLRAKVETAASDHKKYDLDIDVQCPVIKITSGSEAAIVLDLGHANLRTKKLAGVADANLLHNGSPDTDIGNAVERTVSWELPTTRQVGGDVASWTSPNRGYSYGSDAAPDSPSRNRNVLDSTFQSFGGSVLMGAPSRVNDSFRGGQSVVDPTSISRVESQGADLFFYDTYELDYTTGPFTVESKTRSPFAISSGVEIRATFHKSILPADHSLYRFKVHIEIGEVAVSYSMALIPVVRGLVDRWTEAISRKADFRGTIEDLELITARVVEDSQISSPAFDEESESGSLFDENEFFDAMENNSYESDDVTAWLDENWIADSESVLDSETQSMGHGRRRRERPRSISDVSSLSDNSASRRRRQYQDTPYLSAENLARLEEEAGDDSGTDDDGGSSADSFHSAVSPAHLEAAARELEQHIAETELVVLDLKDKLSAARKSREISSTQDEESREAIRPLLLEYRKAKAELDGLRAAHVDLAAQLAICTLRDSEFASDSIPQAQASRSVRRASILMQSRRRRSESAILNGHSITRDLKRNMLQMSILVHEARFTVTDLLSGTSDSSGHLKACNLSVSESALLFRKRATDSRIYFNIDGGTLSLQTASETNSDEELLFVGGLNCVKADSRRAPSIPHLVGSPSIEESFVKGSFEVRSGISRGVSSPFKATKLRIAFGDLEFSPQQPWIMDLERNVHELCREIREVRGDHKPLRQPKPDRPNIQQYFDGVCHCSAIRLHLQHDGTHFGAVGITELSFRAVGGSSSRVLRDRSQFDLRCSNVQIIAIDGVDSSIFAEVFGKKDVYSPLIKIRCRCQLVPDSELGGWVLDQRSSIKQEELRDACLGNDNGTSTHVWNCFVNAKVESFTALVIPGWISSFKQAVSSFVVPGRGVTEGKNNEKQGVESNSLRSPIRWRMDFQHRHSSLEFREDIVESPVDSERRIILSWRMFVVSQRSATVHSGLSIETSIEDLTLTRFADEWPVLEPMSIKLCLDLATNSVLSEHIDQPQLQVQQQPQDVSRVKEEIFEDVAAAYRDTITSPQISISLCVTSIKFNVSAGLCFTLMNVLRDFANVRRSRSGLSSAEQKSDLEGHRQSTGTKSRSQKAVISIQEICIAVHRDGQIKRSFSENDCLFSASIIRPVLSLSGGSNGAGSLHFEATNITLTDFSWKPGALILERNGGIVNPDNLPLVKLTAELAQVRKCHRLSVRLNTGALQLVLLPSFFQSISNFKNELLKGTTGSSVVDNAKSDKNLLLRIREAARKFESVAVDVNIKQFDCLLPSKNIPKYLRGKSDGHIGAVLIRSRMKARVALDVDTEDDILSIVDRVASTDFTGGPVVTKYLGSSYRSTHKCTLCLSDVDVHVHGFQVLRTAVSTTVKVPHSFFQTPPTSGEQRITNAFNFGMVHKLCASLYVRPGETDVSLVIAHALQVKAEFVDVLVYISQSEGGISEATRATVVPILQILKSSKPVRKPEEGHRGKSNNGVVDALIGSSFIFSIRADGVQMTCVPGGATRLTESPIVKLALLRIAAGGSATPVKSDVSTLSGRSLEAVAASAGVHLRHVLAGSWFACEISASYHNRRLVAWEPFLEPWQLKIRLGVDLMQLLNLRPLTTGARLEPDEASVSSLTTSNDGRGRLRDIGRLFSSPFSRSTGDQKVEEDAQITSETDFCYYILYCTGTNQIRDAVIAQNSVPTKKLWSILPHRDPSRWLSRFGFPPTITVTVNSSVRTNSFSCWVSDSTTLNVNISGALIENLRQFVGVDSTGYSRKMAPHRIRNDSGLSVRFREVLDVDRVSRGEKASRVTISSGTEAPLNLKRSISQSCDPHRAYIALEIGSFEDTIGRVEHLDLQPSKGSRFPAFSYRISAKVPVDTVGIHHYPLEANHRKRLMDARSKSSSNGQLGWVIVRVSIKGGIKIVSIESPVMLKNASNTDLLFEVRDQSALSLVWRSVLLAQKGGIESISPIPADIAHVIHKNFVVSVIALAHRDYQDEYEVDTMDVSTVTQIPVPRPYSQSSLSKGLIGERHVSLNVYTRNNSTRSDRLHLSLCFVRIGGFAFDSPSKSKAPTQIPEQRMIVVRPPVVFRNHLAFSIAIEVREKVNDNGRALPWTLLGNLQCGEDCSWDGALPSDQIEIRVRLCGPDGSEVRQFPSWSLPIDIPPESENDKRPVWETHSVSHLSKVKIVDSSDIPLFVTAVATKGGVKEKIASSCDSTRGFSTKLAAASRVICFYTPFWIVDGTGLDLEYKCGSMVAGQGDSSPLTHRKIPSSEDHADTLGLGELLEDSDLIYLPSRLSFQVLMIGDDGCTRLYVRRRGSRQLTVESGSFPWSDPIPLSKDESFHDTFVRPAGNSHYTSDRKENGAFLVRSRTVAAPESLGGHFGTRLAHIVCRYAIVNELGRDIELSEGFPEVVPADGNPRPFHFDDSRNFRFRPKEFGWLWSGIINVRKRRKEVTISLKHKLRGLTIIATLEFRVDNATGMCTVIFRPASRAPYRVANRSMWPLQYRQLSSVFDPESLSKTNETAVETVVLPFHDSEFAWDEPDTGRRTIALFAAAFAGRDPDSSSGLLGCCRIDNLTPGARVRLAHGKLFATVVSDGPTRVLRISEPSKDAVSFSLKDSNEDSDVRKDRSTPSFFLSVKLPHGLGISVVDWAPRELIYFRVYDVSLEQRIHAGKEMVKAAVGSIIADNQLWVTPFPVALRMGSPSQRRRNRRNNAMTLSWTRSKGASRDLILFDKLELSTEPSVVSVDGNLAACVLDMAQQIREVCSVVNTKTKVLSRNALLKKVLEVEKVEMSTAPAADHVALDLYSAFDHMATVAIAAKLRSHYKPPDQVLGRLATSDPDVRGARSLQNKRKYYIERLRISTTKLEISWSGPLPFFASSFPRIMRPGLTFEGLPVLLRPFSSSQNYGEADELLQVMKSHYISIWRILDLFVGVLANPTFIIRAFVFTWRESVASSFESIASVLKAGEAGFSSLVQKNESGKIVNEGIFRALAMPVITFNCSLLGTLSQAAMATSTVLRYDASRHRAKAGLIRSRNPRLFANVDGKDLLVEYVEGENAGKALLSRVRKGVHLGEGYVFHIEGAHPPKKRQRETSLERDSTSLILMLTFERMLLLNGELNDDFCGVIWEVAVKDLVFVEQKSGPGDGFAILLLWYLEDDSNQFKRDDLYVTQAKSLVAGAGGLSCMRCKHIFIPCATARQLFAKIRQIDFRLIEESSD